MITHPGSRSDRNCRSSLPNTSAWGVQTDYLQHTFSHVTSTPLILKAYMSSVLSVCSNLGYNQNMVNVAIVPL